MLPALAPLTIPHVRAKKQKKKSKGEIAELKEDLRSPDRSRAKEAVKKVIAAMTVGKDVAMLFPDVANRAQTDDLELKKLVYLYLINYAKTQPDLAIMAVNTFVKDAQDPNPLVRALAVRTMGCIRVDKIVEYLCDPLARALKVSDERFLGMGEKSEETRAKRRAQRRRRDERDR